MSWKASIRPAGNNTGMYRWFVAGEGQAADGWAKSVKQAQRRIKRAKRILVKLATR